MLELLAAWTVGYLLGSFPSAMLVARAVGRDIFRTGSGNMGAMNTARNVGWLPGVAVLVLDVLKGALAVQATIILAGMANGGDAAPLFMPYAAAFGAIVGHAWSVFARFRGGKALATTLGVSLPLFPLAGLYTFLLLVAFALLTRRSHPSSLAAIALFPVVVGVVLNRAGVDPDSWFAAITTAALISVVVAVKHLTPARTADGRSA